MSNFKADCRKFQPNIFNKIKCSNCFRQREEHSAEALESNRASRKVSKCGYLFVAPDWDFSNPLNRTKRWQRRWFVLYDDGELTYSVDDLPATIPQGVIDMNRVLEVSEAEDVTGNQFALAITSPDRATFVKGTCREESRWWRDVLSVFPRTHKQLGRHKRNATFPGIKSSSVLQQSRTALGRTPPSPSLAPASSSSSSSSPNHHQRVRFHSCTSESFVSRPSSAPTLGGQGSHDDEDDVFPTKDPSTTAAASGVDLDSCSAPSSPPLYSCTSSPMTSLPPSTRLLRDEDQEDDGDEHKENTPPYIEDYRDNPPTSESPPTQDKVLGHHHHHLHRPRTRRTAKREARGLAHPRSKSEVSLLPPYYAPPTNPPPPPPPPSHLTSEAASATTRINNNNKNSSGNSPLDDYTNWKANRALRRNTVTSPAYSSSVSSMLTSPYPSYVSPFVTNYHPRLGGSSMHAWRDEGTSAEDYRSSRFSYSDFPSVRRFLTSNTLARSSDLEESKREEKLKDIADSLTRPRPNSSLPYLSKESGVKPTRESESSQEHQFQNSSLDDVTDSSLTEQIRGDPDGCGLDVEVNHFPQSSDTQRVDLPAEDILYIKKGWLLKQAYGQEWNKHWFVLEGSGLKFYRDPNAEDNGILDGIIDMGMVKDVQEKDVGRNYGFIVTTWDDKKFVFSAVTCGIRSNWVQAMRNAANLKEPVGRPLTLGEKLEKEMKANKDSNNSSFVSLEAERDVSTTPVASMSRSQVSSDSEDFKTASDSSFLKDLSRDDVTYDRFSVRSSSRVSTPSQRSRSSPPPSRRATRDDFPSNSLGSTSKPNPVTTSSSLSETNSVQSMQDLDAHPTPEKDSSTGTMASTGEGMLLELLETQVESLKAKLEQTQITELKSQIARQEEEIKEKNKIISKIESIRKQLQDERKDWDMKLHAEESKVMELKASESKHAEIVRRLSKSLQEAELKANSLTQELKKVNEVKSSILSSEMQSNTKTENSELKQQVNELAKEITRLKEALKSEKSEVYKWKDLVKELRSLLDGRNEDMEMKREEVSLLREKLKQTQSELDSTADRLHRGIEENENLCGRLREFERHAQSQAKVRRGSSNLSITNSKKNIPRLDSLSDLTNLDLNFDPDDLEKESLVEEFIDLRMRFEKAVNEIRALKREVRNAETLQDDMELTNQRLRTEMKNQEEDFKSQINLMGTRVQDLTAKLTNSEKQVRTLKQKLSRNESRERRRTLSLKGKESFSLSKDLESKLSQLESKVHSLMGETEGDQDKSTSSPKEARRSKSFEDATKRTRLRRKSLDGQVAEDAINTVLRVNALEEKVCSLSGKELRELCSSTSISSCGTSQTNGDVGSSGVYSPSTKSKSPNMSPMRSPASQRKTSGSKAVKSTSDKVIKLTRSESEPKLLREKVTCLEKVLSLVQSKSMEDEHRDAMQALQNQHQAEIDRLRDQVKYDPPTRDSDDELTELKRRLCLLEEGYEAQIAALKKQYQDALGSQSDVCEENIRQRYQLEIEHLRELCEKGLTAMETSHRRLVAEMEAKHRREMEQLQAEKEEALAEETQATLAALDAMRKAHEAEVQKEVAKFKEEFLRRAESGREGEVAHSRLHEEELREVRREILALSEKYSGKCLEMAAKEQKAESLQRQLTETKAQARSLEERNRILKQRLNVHLSQLESNAEKSPVELQHQYECELALKDEEIAWLNQMLQKTKMVETETNIAEGIE